MRGLRGAYCLGNADNGDNAGSAYLNGNNAPSNANANRAACLNRSEEYPGVSLPYRENISKDGGETRRIMPSVIPAGTIYRPFPNRPINVSLKTPRIRMRRIRDDRENETQENARKAFENFSKGKCKRADIRRFESQLDDNLCLVLDDIINETFEPEGYQDKVIFERKERHLAKAPVRDHVTEAAAILPYEQQVYDYISWRAPAVRPGLGNHAMFRFLRNDLYRSQQQEVYYNLTMDIHHYFPLMDHEVLKQKVDNKFKQGKLRRFIHKVIDSYLQGAPLGIKLSQLYGMLCLADFDRFALRCFDIGKVPERMAYWTQRYVTEIILTACTPDEERLLGRGCCFLAERFRRFVGEGLQHYYRFVDNFVVLHEDKTFLRLMRELLIMHLTRDYHCQLNTDHQVRPTWMGIRLCGYVFYHENVDVSKRNKQELAREVKELQKRGLDEEQIRIRLSSRLGFVKHADCINLLKSLGMEKSLGKIIRKRRVRPPFQDMSPEQKVSFSTVVTGCEEMLTGGGKNKFYKVIPRRLCHSRLENRKRDGHRQYVKLGR